ncbi:MAG: OmpH family outer membrane protein [Crocinitomicaceae bacterium]
MENNMLAKISLGINAVLIIAVIALFVKMPSGSGDSAVAEDDSTSVEVVNDGELTIAYYNGDSLNSTSFMTDLQAQMQAVQTKGEQKMAAEQAKVEKWSQKWNQKSQTGLLPREQEQYYKEAAQMEQDMAYAQQSIQMEAAQETEQLMLTLYTRIQVYSKSFAEKNNIDLMLQYQLGNVVSYGAPHLDVTAQFMKHVDNEYNSTFTEEEGIEEESAE